MNNLLRLRRAILLTLLMAVTITADVCAQSSGYPTLDTLLMNTLDSMRTVLGAKSLNAAIQFPDTAVWADASGISTVSTPANTNMAYLIGSVTKTITTACILQLADAGTLSLDDSLHEWLDTIQYVNPDLTIRQLLRHQSGLYDVLNNPAFNTAMNTNPGFSWPADSMVKYYLLPPTGTPGGSWSYCNTNFFLLGMIIESATGNPFYAEYRNRFFNNYGYTSFGIPSFEPYSQPVAHVWIDTNGDGILDDAHNSYFPFNALNSAAGAAGGFYATASDLTRWTRTYLRGDVASPAMMTEAQTMINASGSQGGKYGLGLMRNTFQGLTAYGHGGDLGYAASSWYFPARDISISVLMNHNGLTSWNLLPVVNALLKTYNDWLLTTSLEQPAQTAEVSVFPNPFTDQLHLTLNNVSMSGQPEVVLQNAIGQTLLTGNSMTSTNNGYSITLDGLSYLPSGMYIVRVIAEGETICTGKVIR